MYISTNSDFNNIHVHACTRNKISKYFALILFVNIEQKTLTKIATLQNIPGVGGINPL